MRQKLRAKQAGEGGTDQEAAKRAEAKRLEEESVTREKSIGSGGLPILGWAERKHAQGGRRGRRCLVNSLCFVGFVG